MLFFILILNDQHESAAKQSHKLCHVIVFLSLWLFYLGFQFRMLFPFPSFWDINILCALSVPVCTVKRLYWPTYLPAFFSFTKKVDRTRYKFCIRSRKLLFQFSISKHFKCRLFVGRSDVINCSALLSFRRLERRRPSSLNLWTAFHPVLRRNIDSNLSAIRRGAHKM